MKKILINQNPWQTRIAITNDGLLQNIYFSDHAQHALERVFFKGIVTKVLPGIQTAFVDIGQEKAGFLHISEIDHELAIERITKHLQLEDEDAPPARQQRQQRDISKILKEGEPILVQVSKEPVYEKGAKLTTCFTLPGRFVVLMPVIPRIGVSKKIEEREERYRLKEIVRQALPEGMGAIIRTTSEARHERDIQKDIAFLVDTWNMIKKKYDAAEPKEKIYEDIELPLQIIRDHLDDDVEQVITDNTESQKNIYKFIKAMSPEYTDKIKLYHSTTPLLEYYNIDRQIEAALDKKVPLSSGGSLIIESTEAMTVVDVNTGKFTGKRNLEETIFTTNMEAAQETVRQLRLRNIGGLIVIDFIDMSSGSNKQKLFKFFEKTLKERDKFQSVVLKISEFGLVQMTRKRSGLTLVQQLTQTCFNCKGLGFIKSVATQAHALLRSLKQELPSYTGLASLSIILHPQVFEHITSVEYNAILDIEKTHNTKITLVSDPTMALDRYKLEKK